MVQAVTPMLDFSRESPIRVRSVAERFKVSEQTVHKWRKRTDRPLAMAKVGGRLYTTESAIRHFVGESSFQSQQISEDPLYGESMERLKKRLKL